jgi:glycosyltransferase involved in cell wall biosynthesis
MTLRIAFVTQEYSPRIHGGAGVYVDNLTRELAALECEIHVLAPNLGMHTADDQREGCFIHWLPSVNLRLLYAPSFWFYAARRYARIEREIGGFDVLHGQLLSDIILKTVRRSLCARVITVHHLGRDAVEFLNPSFFGRIRRIGTEVGLTPSLEGFWMSGAGRIITVSQFSKKRIADVYGIDPLMIDVTYPGVSPEQYSFSEYEIQKFKAEYLKTDKPIVLFVGRINDPRKGLDFMLKAFAKVLETNDAVLVIAGKGDSRTVENEALKLGISERIILTGYVNDGVLRRLYASCDVYACPSRLEGFGSTVVEAMAAGKPVVATNVGAIPEVVMDSGNNSLVEPDDDMELASLISQYLADTTMGKEVGQRNLSFVRKKYNWRNCAQATKTIYENLLSR